ncbi:hypothetical protein [Rhodopirellula halodulae]|uniref:hypothetical protein n=1 Tax=Rhodopirellula halodulae TaxID=2894198 RepID=UPI001E29E5E9|nr:hypothetical protein [Rhodopirellula sp. JC737]MCC9654911.1 hypothetical protein [Rhodopirellula sp. JC737]
MTRRSFIAGLFALAFAATPCAFAEGLPKSESKATQVANDLDQHEASIRALDRQFFEAVAELEQSYVSERKELREQITEKLKKHQKTLTQKGDLDAAVSVRDKAESIRESKFAIPNSNQSPDAERSILGTWRWNNGVDIKNLGGGKTNGNGTWRLVDAKEQAYEFKWSRIPADRVRLSANGRVLEGTKAHDPSFRVWAVRID